MVDRHARDVAAEALREFMSGSISNKDYEWRFPRGTRDPALEAIYSYFWFSYSDTKEHTMTGDHAITDEGRAVVQRCLLFLKSDLAFQWPARKLLLAYPILRLIGLGWIVNRSPKRESSLGGEIDVWPCFTKAQYAQCKEASQR
jgi:hypothetical protein